MNDWIVNNCQGKIGAIYLRGSTNLQVEKGLYRSFITRPSEKFNIKLLIIIAVYKDLLL